MAAVLRDHAHLFLSKRRTCKKTNIIRVRVCELPVKERDKADMKAPLSSLRLESRKSWLACVSQYLSLLPGIIDGRVYITFFPFC